MSGVDLGTLIEQFLGGSRDRPDLARVLEEYLASATSVAAGTAWDDVCLVVVDAGRLSILRIEEGHLLETEFGSLEGAWLTRDRAIDDAGGQPRLVDFALQLHHPAFDRVFLDVRAYSPVEIAELERSLAPFVGRRGGGLIESVGRLN